MSRDVVSQSDVLASCARAVTEQTASMEGVVATLRSLETALSATSEDIRLGHTVTMSIANGAAEQAATLVQVNQNLGGVTVCDVTENNGLIEAADLVIITGMTLPNRTLPSLIEAAKINNTSTMIWAVTGKNLGHFGW